MGLDEKDARWMYFGLGILLVGCVWLVLSGMGVLRGMDSMLGFPLGIGLALTGFIVAGVYYFRYRRIKLLLQGKGVLVDWQNGDARSIIAPGSAFVDGELLLWGTPGTRLDAVTIDRQSHYGSGRSYLDITYAEATNARDAITGSRLWRTERVSIAIPAGQELAAQIVVDQLLSQIPTK